MRVLRRIPQQAIGNPLIQRFFSSFSWWLKGINEPVKFLALHLPHS